MDLALFPYFLVSSILLTLAPGPDNLYLLTKSLADGAKAGITLAAGLCSGIVFHTCLVILGVAALVKSSPVAFAALKYVGAAYLFYLAYGAFTAKVAKSQPTEESAGQTTAAGSNSTTNSVSSNESSSQASNGKSSSQTSNGESSALAIYRKGLIMNILNPKVLLFFLAFLPQFVDPNNESPGLAIAILGAVFSLQAFILFSIIALCAGKLRGFLNQGPKSQRMLNRIQGVVLLGIGGLLLVF
ncbi:MAG: LysE family translocator [Veillonella sp.]|uniref:LysE family translocator n=1 Tax=Veillonella sp. TaxID=1926307 RepID=UPI0025D8A375|nr:LysE family translocator [Veillonella sp.]MBE6080594.1 LysE family translocator [Veillonella sp.]